MQCDGIPISPAASCLTRDGIKDLEYWPPSRSCSFNIEMPPRPPRSCQAAAAVIIEMSWLKPAARRDRFMPAAAATCYMNCTTHRPVHQLARRKSNMPLSCVRIALFVAYIAVIPSTPGTKCPPTSLLAHGDHDCLGPHGVTSSAKPSPGLLRTLCVILSSTTRSSGQAVGTWAWRRTGALLCGCDRAPLLPIHHEPTQARLSASLVFH